MTYDDDPSGTPPFDDSGYPRQPYSQGPSCGSYGSYGNPYGSYGDPYGFPGQDGASASGSGPSGPQQGRPNPGTTQSPFPHPASGAAGGTGSGYGYGYRPGRAPEDRNPYPSPFSGPYSPYAMTQRPERRGSGVKIAIGVVAAVIALFVGIGWAVVWATQSMVNGVISSTASQQAEADSSDPQVGADGRVKNQKTYDYSPSDDFERYSDAVNAMYTKYKNLSDDELKDILPEYSKEGVKQYGAFLTILTDLKSALYFGDSRVTTDPQEITDYYNGQIAYLKDLESRFLEGKALGVSVHVKGLDGTVLEVDGDEDPAYTKPEDVDALTAQWESKIKAVPISQGSDGSYLQTGETLIASVGLTPNYDFQAVHKSCTMSGRLGDDETLAAYCPVTQSIVYINQNIPGFSSRIQDVYYPNAIKHELAHAMIHRICGTAQPPVGVDSEALTNSYTTLYFGGDRDVLQRSADGASWYRMTDASDEAARQVHAGECRAS